MNAVDLAELNAAGDARFVALLAHIFEDSPWIPRAVAAQRPFASVEVLHRAMCDAVEAAPREAQIALIAAHPDLVGAAARDGRLGDASRAEQASAGLDRLDDGEIATFTSLNAAYRERFGFPFVICVREHRKAAILAGLRARTHNDRDVEIATALAEIAKIARLRLRDAVHG